MALQTGDKAPNFTLRNTEKSVVSLEDYAGGNLLILFFPLAFTSVCTAELCEVRDNLNAYESLETAVVGISVDSLFTLEKFKGEEGINFPLLSDFNKTASQAYDCMYKDFVLDMQGVSKRSAFIVDAKGIIRYAEVLENAGDVPNFAAIKDILSQLN